MRKILVVLLATGFVAALPSLASAKKQKPAKQVQTAQAVQPADAGPRFVGNMLYQIVVPWEQTFGPKR